MANALIIKELIKELKTNPYAFEKKIGTGSSTISKAIKNNSEIDLDLIQKITTAYPEVNKKWLETGNGDMILKDKILPPANTDKDYRVLYEQALERTNNQLSEAISNIFTLAKEIALSLAEARSDQMHFAQTQIRNQQVLQNGMNLLLAKFFPDQTLGDSPGSKSS